MSVKSSDAAATRERLPFKLVDADGHATELTYSSPHPAADHHEQSVLDELPWFDAGQPLHNWMLHETDFYDEVEQIWGRRWGAEGIGKLREVLVSRPTENETRPEYAQEWQYYYSSAAGNADLGRLQAQFDEYYQVLTDHGVRVNYIEPHGRGIGEPGAGRWLDPHTFVFNNSVVANEEGLRQIEFVLNGLGIELVTAYSPGWIGTTGNGNIGTTHADMFLVVPDRRLAVLAPHLVNYAFVRYLMRRDFRIIEVPVEEYWDLAVNAVTLEPGKLVMNAGSPSTLRALEREGVEVIQVDFSESHKFAIAGLHCATLELVRDQSEGSET